MPAKFNINGDAIRQLAEILVSTDLSEIEYESEGNRVRVARHQSPIVPYLPPASHHGSAPVVRSLVEEESSMDLSTHPGVIKSPMVGTVYSAAEPGGTPFVKVGDLVFPGQTLLIIEAMKVMNPIQSAKSGKVVQIFFSDAQPVEYGEPLLIIEPA